MQEVEASILEIGIAQGIVCFISKKSLVSLMLLNFNLSFSCSLLSNLNLHIKYSKFVAREAFRSLRALRFLISFDCFLMTFGAHKQGQEVHQLKESRSHHHLHCYPYLLS